MKNSDSRGIKLQKYNSDYLYFEKNTMDFLWEIQELINYTLTNIKFDPLKMLTNFKVRQLSYY